MEENGQAPESAATETGGTNEPQFVTTEQLNQFSEKLSGDVKAMLGRVPHLVQEQMATKEAQTQQPAPKEKGSKDNFDPKSEVARILKEEREALARDRMAIDKQRIRGALEQELVNNGANPSAVKMAADSLMMRNDGKLTIDSNELGESSIQFKADEYSEGVGIGDFVRGFLTSDEGSSVVQPKKSPSVKGVPNGRPPIVGEVVKMTRLEASKADPKLLMSGRVQFID